MARILDGVVAIFGIQCEGRRCGSVEGKVEGPRLCLALLGAIGHANPRNRESQMHALGFSKSRAPA